MSPHSGFTSGAVLTHYDGANSAKLDVSTPGNRASLRTTDHAAAAVECVFGSGFGVAANTAVGANSVLRASSEAAFRAADDPAAIFIKDKHLASSVGRWAKFDSTDVGKSRVGCLRP